MSLTNKSLQNNITKVCDKLSDQELVDLSNYLAYGFMSEPMTKLQEEIIDKLFGLVEWAEFIQNEHKRREHEEGVRKHWFISRPWFDLDEYRCIIMFQITKRFNLRISKIKVLEAQLKLAETNLNIENTKRDLLKSKIKGAVIDSYEDGIFYKDNGWCNLSDVLIEENLLELPEE